MVDNDFHSLPINQLVWQQIRAGTGGDEAALFAADLMRMYQRYAEAQSWKVAHLSESPGETGGLKEVIVQVSSHCPRVRPCTAANLQ